MRRSIWPCLLARGCSGSACPAAARSATCTADDFAARRRPLRRGAARLQRRGDAQAQDKLKQLKDKKGWDDADYEEKALADLRDQRTAKLDADAEDLIVKIDTLGRPPATRAARLLASSPSSMPPAWSCWR